MLNLENRFQVVLGYKKNLVHNQTVAAGAWQQEKDVELALKELLAPLNLVYKQIGDKTYVIKAKPKETSLPKNTSWSPPSEGLPAAAGASALAASVDQSPPQILRLRAGLRPRQRERAYPA